MANTVVAITTDMLAPVTTLKSSATLTAKGQQNISLSMSDMPAPGIYKATITVNDDLARSFFFAVNPTQIVSAPDMQSDFNSYWSAAKQQLTAIPVNATLTEIPARSGTKRKVCPPHTNLAPYNNVQTPEAYKQIVYNPELQHATNSNWNSTYMAFFKASPSTGIINSPLSIINYQNDTWYTLDGRRIANGQWTMDNGQLQLPRGIYIVNGRKVIKKLRI